MFAVRWEVGAVEGPDVITPEVSAMFAKRSGDGAAEGPDEDTSTIEEDAAILEFNSID